MRSKAIILGSLELKKAYQRSVIIGFMSSIFIHLSVIGLILLVASSDRSLATITHDPATQDTIRVLPPILARQQAPARYQTKENRPKPAAGIPMPVPDNDAPPQSNIPTQRDLTDIIKSTSIADLDENVAIDAGALAKEFLPSPDTFIAYEEPPAPIRAIQPIYPKLAQRAGVEGIVWLKVLIDKNGNVPEVLVLKKSRTDAGFEEAAVEATKQTSWRPAISNGQPVAVWVTYAVNFKLR
jgi:protein TonB